MAKPFKIFLWVIGGVLALLVTAAVALPLIFDPNDYRDEIAVAAKDNTGRTVEIRGEIDLSVFPWLSVEVNDVVMSNAPGFGPEPFAQVAHIDAGVRLLPLLLDREVRIGTVTIEGLRLNLAKSKDGTTNWADLGAREEAPAPQAPDEKPDGPPMAFSVGGLNVRDASLAYTDAQTGAAHKLDKLNLETGPVEPGKPLDVALSFLAVSAQPQAEADVRLAFKALADLEQKKYEAQDLKLDVTATGAGVPGGKQEIAMRGKAAYDQAAGALSLPEFVVEAAGVVLTAAITGENLGGEAPRLSGKISTNTFSPREVTRKLAIVLPSTADPAALSQASVAANYSGDFNSARLDGLTLKLDQTTATGSLKIADFANPALEFALKADAIDADRYLAPEAKQEPGADKNKGGGDFRETPIPVAALDAVTAKGTVELGSLKVKGLKMNEVRLALNAPKGKVKTQELTAQLYGGKIAQSARITPGAKPTYDIKAGLANVNTNPLLTDLVGKGWLSGAGNFNLALSTGGATLGDALKALDGSLSTSLLNGALEGFNLKQTIEEAKAKARGEAAASDKAKRTEFKDLAAGAKIVDGVLKTDTLKASGEDYQLTGDGDVNLVAQEIDYVLRPTYTAGSNKGVTVPVAITGSLFDPKVRVDFKGLVQDQARQEIKKQEEKLKEKASEKIEDFFRKREKKKTPAEPPPTTPPAETAPAQPAPAQPAPAEPAPAEQPPAQ